MKFYGHRVLGLSFLVCVVLLIAEGSFSEGTSTEASKASEWSYWSIDPENATIKPRVSYVPGVKVIRGDTHLIVPEHKSFCPAGSVFQFNNGDIEVYNRRSSDGGETWVDAGHILENSTYQYPEPDGEVLMFESFYSCEHSTGGGRPEASVVKSQDEAGVLEAKLLRSSDNGVTRVAERAKIYLPEQFAEWTGRLSRKIVGLKDGSLLMSMYGRHENGTKIERKYLSLAIRSTDRGKTWRYLSTIAIDRSETARGEGFDETSLLVLPDGDVLSFLRSGASYQASMGSFNNNDPSVDMPFGYAKQTPVYLTRSVDGGAHWGAADPINSFGVWPDALLMENGLLVASYGRPGNWIMFSQDEGNSWGPIIPFHHDLYPPDCSNYFSMAEVAPNVLLVVYARTNPNDHWKSELVGTYFYVEHEPEVEVTIEP